VSPSLYGAKRTLLRPRTALMRRRHRDAEPYATAMLEQQLYRRSMFDFMRATSDQPDILHAFPIGPGCVVIDVGAYVGEWTAAISDRYTPTIFAFEPTSEGTGELDRVAAVRPNVHVLRYGLGRRDEVVSFALAGPGSSAFEAAGAYGVSEERLRDVVGVFDELGLDHVDLMKVNIEGGEFDLFERLIEADRLRAIDLLLIQFHEWHPDAYRRRRRIRGHLAESHEEIWDFPWIFECWRRR
jgi:FkbM family methyltransferase